MLLVYQELLYKKARLVLRQMCYMRSREELLFRAAVRFQHKRLDLQEQHSMLVQKARSVGRKKPDDMLDYMSSMSSVSILREITNGPLWRRHRHRHDHRHHYDSSRDSDTRTVHDDVTSGTVRVGLAESQSVHDSTANDGKDGVSHVVSRSPIATRPAVNGDVSDASGKQSHFHFQTLNCHGSTDEPSTSKGIRKRPNNHWHHNRTGNLDGDSDSFASRSQSSVSSPTGKKRRKKDVTETACAQSRAPAPGRPCVTDGKSVNSAVVAADDYLAALSFPTAARQHSPVNCTLIGCLGPPFKFPDELRFAPSPLMIPVNFTRPAEGSAQRRRRKGF
ncbi:hypothetical protein BaRGS_00034420, partial [Batillaria attramentaria]